MVGSTQVGDLRVCGNAAAGGDVFELEHSLWSRVPYLVDLVRDVQASKTVELPMPTKTLKYLVAYLRKLRDFDSDQAFQTMQRKRDRWHASWLKEAVPSEDVAELLRAGKLLNLKDLCQAVDELLNPTVRPFRRIL